MENYNMDFAHFDNEEITEKFIIYLNTINVSVNHRCCNGKGVAILNYNNGEINQFINNFWNQMPKEICLILNKHDICSVCYENTNTAINCEKPHFICQSCFTRVRECPMCRRPINK